MQEQTLLHIDHVNKSFPGVQALNDVSLSVHRGEVHAIVGENGAGKSTLMNILSGLIERDSGDIVFNQQALDICDPCYSQKMGISTVHQELTLAPNLTIMDNIFLWNLPHTALGTVDTQKLRKKAMEYLEELGINHLDPATPVKKLSVSEQQLVEIAKALSYQASMIIMDEPNSALSPTETEFLFTIIRDLRARGVTILFISHRLDEIFKIADRITILRDGKVINTVNTEEVTIDKVVSMMVGRELKQQRMLRSAEARRDTSRKPLLVGKNLSSDGQFSDVSFELFSHEILGLSGLVGAGRTGLAETLFGLRPLHQGEIWLDGSQITINNPSDAVSQGIGFIPEDRKETGLFLKMAVADNINMSSYQRISRNGVVSHQKEITQANCMVDKLSIRLSSIKQKIASLSGGNQQKAIIARWLLVNPTVLILDEPTRGIDVGAKAQIYELISNLADEGMAILLISSELEEILALSDRIMVMRRGSISAEIDRDEATQDLIMTHSA